jgi:hypothetical protein
LSQSRKFNDMPLKPKDCIVTLAKIMYLLLQVCVCVCVCVRVY